MSCAFRNRCPEVVSSGHCLGDVPGKEWEPVEGFMDLGEGGILCLDWDVVVLKPTLNGLPQENSGSEEESAQQIRPECADIAFMVNLVYDRGVALEYDLTCDRLEDAGRRLADLDDMIPQIYGLTKQTTHGEREQLIKALGNVRHYMAEGDTVMAQGAADEFNASFRNIMWSIIIRCERL